MKRPSARALAVPTALLAGILVYPLQAAPNQPDPCPDPFPVADLTAGMAATGLTVERGTDPEPFTASIVGVLEDGIAPDVDMIIAEVDSKAIDAAGGVWAGMSGSPVYAKDGRLIGAVAYGLTAAPSKITGITPAAEMKRVVGKPGGTEALNDDARESAKLPPSLRQPLADLGVPDGAAMQRLPLPMAVSGLAAHRLDGLERQLALRGQDPVLFSAGSAAATKNGDPSDIVPGGNIAAALSYGDITAAGVGTTTAVCDDQAIAFGHPFTWTGASTASIHPTPSSSSNPART